MVLIQEKRRLLEKLSRDDVISALTFDQRGALKRVMANYQTEEPSVEQIEQLKALVSEELTPCALSILLDLEYGLPASRTRDVDAGLLLAYEKTGYDVITTSRLPDCLVEWSAKRPKEEGAGAVKFLPYYGVDDDEYVNLQKQTYIERTGAECKAEDMPFFPEILTYDENITDNTSAAFAEIKPHRVNEAMKVFSDDRFGIDVLEVEVPVNMKYVEGFTGGEVVYTKEEAAKAFKDQEIVSHLPYTYLSAGVSAKPSQGTLVFAAESGAKLNGVLCGCVTWAGSIQVYIEEGEVVAREWLRTQGRKSTEGLDAVLTKAAGS